MSTDNYQQVRPVADLDAPLSLPTRSAPADWSDVLAEYPALRPFADAIGNTPLIEVPGDGGATILAKCEWVNPAGSIKDRVAFGMLAALLREGSGQPLQVLEYSGGNLSLALSLLCQAIGVPLRLVLSSGSPPSLLDTVRGRGAEVELVDKDLGFVAVVRRAIDIARAEPAWSLLYQHRNLGNIQTHETTTGAELLDQLPAGTRLTHWVASIGTGGTLVGVLRALRGRFPDVLPVAVSPAELPYGSDQPPNGLAKYAGSGGFGDGVRQPFVPPIEAGLHTDTVSYPDALAAMAEFRTLTGTAIGSSSAANWLVARKIAADLPASAMVATVFPCAGTAEEWKRLTW
ncbi:MAG: pyridoxal-phosphate dependent enzyme [Actinomycetota bacterium]|nr:pyridoxal-phosphate dependent enzyme [Actinomycetota bacterium]